VVRYEPSSAGVDQATVVGHSMGAYIARALVFPGTCVRRPVAGIAGAMPLW
jgi:hypothetical protein